MTIIKTIRTYKSEYLIKLLSAVILFLICSQAKFYLLEVPFTMQTFAVLLIGYFFDKKSIILSILLSLTILDAEALLTNSALFLYTIGYKIGFILTGLFVSYYKNKLKNLLLFSLGSVITLISGVIYLVFYIGNFGEAISIGLLPFVIPEIVKVIIVTSVVRFIKLKNI